MIAPRHAASLRAFEVLAQDQESASPAMLRIKAQ